MILIKDRHFRSPVRILIRVNLLGNMILIKDLLILNTRDSILFIKEERIMRNENYF